MARLFATATELAFIDRVNGELLQNVSGQLVNYYAFSKQESEVNDLYGESIRKVWSPPVAIYARVRYNNETVKSTRQGQDSQYSLEVYFHTAELIDRNVLPKEGDFVEYGQLFFEITSVTQPQQVFGQIQDRIMTKCVCVPSREGQFQAGNVSSEDVDHSHPVESRKNVNR